MVVVSHPFGNANVRAVLDALEADGLLARYVTALGWSNSARWLQLMPAQVLGKLARRGYSLPPDKIHFHPQREVVRLLAADRPVAKRLVEHERGWASIDQVWPVT